MHGLDSLVPFFITRVRGTRIVVTSDIVSEVLHVPRVEHLDYPGCERLANWGDRQFTPCSTFAKGPRLMTWL